jgi:hypothetical protein
MKNRAIYILGIIFILLPFLTSPTFAQSEEEILSLRLSRDFGYSSGSGDIQGTFSLRASGPDDLVKVIFFMDEQVMGEITQAPFSLRFSTDDFSPGIHRMTAVGYTSAGQELHSNEIQAEFVTAEQGYQQTLKFILPLFGFIALAVLISLLFPMILTRGKTTSLSPGAARNYSPFGGTICPKCQRPFGMHLYGLNLLVGKYDRCPYCGKWSLVRSANPAQLAAAEAAELDAAAQASSSSLSSPTDKAEQLKKELSDSKYQDM